MDSRRACVTLVLAFALAGCTQAEPSGESPSEGTGNGPGDDGSVTEAPRVSQAGGVQTAQANDTVRSFARQYQREEMAVRTPSAYNGLGGANCIAFDDELTILNGNATISWTADGPVAPEMEIFLDVRQSGRAAYASGPSPLRIEFVNVTTGGGTFGTDVMLVWQVSSNQPVGVALNARGTLDLAFDYRGEEASPDDNWSCSHG